jgi:hypothetical protein
MTDHANIANAVARALVTAFREPGARNFNRKLASAERSR